MSIVMIVTASIQTLKFITASITIVRYYQERHQTYILNEKLKMINFQLKQSYRYQCSCIYIRLCSGGCKCVFP